MRDTAASLTLLAYTLTSLTLLAHTLTSLTLLAHTLSLHFYISYTLTPLTASAKVLFCLQNLKEGQELCIAQG